MAYGQKTLAGRKSTNVDDQRPGVVGRTINKAMNAVIGMIPMPKREKKSRGRKDYAVGDKTTTKAGSDTPVLINTKMRESSAKAQAGKLLRNFGASEKASIGRQDQIIPRKPVVMYTTANKTTPVPKSKPRKK